MPNLAITEMAPYRWELDVDGTRLVIELQSNNAGTEFYASIRPFDISVTAYLPDKMEEGALDMAIRAYEDASLPAMPWTEIKRELRARGAFGSGFPV